MNASKKIITGGGAERLHQDFIEAHECDENLVNCIEADNRGLMPRVPDAAEFRRETIDLLERFIKFCEKGSFFIS
jgi:hypothetical protein